MSEDYGHIRKLLNGAGFSVINLGLGLFLGLILTPYVVRMLGDRHNGIYILAGTFTAWFSLLDLGLYSAVSRFVTLYYAKNDMEKCNAISNTALFLYILIGIVGALIATGIGVGALLLRPNMEDVNLFSVVIVIFGVAFLFKIPQNAFAGTVYGVIRSDLVEIWGFVFRALGAIQTFIILYFGGRLIYLALGNLLIVLLNLGVLYRLAKKTLSGFHISARYFHRSEVKSLFGYSVFTLIRNIGSVLVLRTGTLLIAAFVSLSAVTHYQVIACNLSYNFMSLMLAMTAWLTSWLTLLHSRGDDAMLLKTMHLGHKFSIYVASFITFGLIVWGKAFIIRWMGPAYLDAYPALVVNTLYFWLMLSQTVNSRYLFAIAQHRFLAYTILAEGVLNLTIGLILVPNYGMLGVATGVAAAGVLTNGVAIPVVVCRFLRMKLLNYYRHFIARSAIAALALVLPVIVSHYWIGPSYPKLFAVGMACAALYFPVIYFIGLTREDRARILSLLPGKAFKAAVALPEDLT